MSVAVIDSGVNPWHPHIGALAEAVAIPDGERLEGEIVDRLGHGTAVAAAIHEKAPAAELHVVKLFYETLSTNLEALIRALDWSAERGVRLVNLSLGTANPEHAPALAGAIARLRDAGGVLVSARHGGGRSWYPGVLPGALGVDLDPTCPRDHVRFDGPGPLRASASGFARPIPGVPPERNLNGVSFAVANATGVLACALEGRGSISTVEGLQELLGLATKGDPLRPGHLHRPAG